LPFLVDSEMERNAFPLKYITFHHNYTSHWDIEVKLYIIHSILKMSRQRLHSNYNFWVPSQLSERLTNLPDSSSRRLIGTHARHREDWCTTAATTSDNKRSSRESFAVVLPVNLCVCAKTMLRRCALNLSRRLAAPMTRPQARCFGAQKSFVRDDQSFNGLLSWHVRLPLESLCSPLVSVFLHLLHFPYKLTTHFPQFRPTAL
jgi:hypothetical protein